MFWAGLGQPDIEHPANAPVRIGFHPPAADIAVQGAFVELLDPAPAHMAGCAVADRIQFPEVLVADTAHRPHGMSRQLAERIVARQPRLHLRADKAMPVDGQGRDFLFRQGKLEGYRLERPAAQFEPFLELVHVTPVERYDFAQFRDERLEVVDAFPDQGQAVYRPVLRQGNAVAVVDDAPRRGERLDADSIFVRPGPIDIVLPDLQLHHAKHQQQRQPRDHGEQRQRAADERLVFGVPVLDSKRRRHGSG